MKCSPSSACLFIALNIIRALSIATLILVFASSIFVLVDDVEAVNRFVNGGTNTTSFDFGDVSYVPNSTVPNQPAGVFWAVLNRLLIIFQTVVLLLSEFAWPEIFLDRFFPVLGRDFGVGALGAMQCLIGASVLSHYVETFPLVTAFLLFSVGCLNIFVGLIFRERGKDTRNILSWRERNKDVLPSNVRHVGGGFPHRDERSMTSVPLSPPLASSRRSGMGFGTRGEKAAQLKGFLLGKPVASLAKSTTRLDESGPMSRGAGCHADAECVEHV